MSEEEIIKDLKNFIALAQKEENFIYYSEYKFDNELAERVQGLLDLYKKEKEKNNNLQYDKKFYQGVIDELKETNKELEEEIENWKFTKKYVQDNYIDKDKIRLLIKEYEFTEHNKCLNIPIKAFKKLLGDDKDEWRRNERTWTYKKKSWIC